jgi:hypothetical protein
MAWVVSRSALRLPLLAATLALAFSAAPAQAALPDRVVSFARAELALGVRELPRGSNDSRRIAVYRTAVRWADGPAAWCGYFASWVARQAGAPVGDRGEGIGLVTEFRRWATRTGRWRTAPRRGDIVVFRHFHVGVVEAVRGATIVTIEGNHDQRVARVQRSRGEIRGYVRLSPPRPSELADAEPWSNLPEHRTSGRTARSSL